MRDIVVAVDLETTGLDPDYDAIIEIGAVKFQGSDTPEEWHTLVNPGRSLSTFITQLTGITDRDVSHAPAIAEVLPQLRRFIGGAPILGHNVRFDTTFLIASGLGLRNPVIDTYVLASVMLPDAARYNLSALSAQLDLPSNDAHRALNDAYTTVSLFQTLWDRVMALPLDTLAEIVRLGKQMPWDGELVFEAALQDRSREVFTAPKQVSAAEIDEDIDQLFSRPAAPGETLRPRQEIVPLDIDELAGLIEPGGQLTDALEGYEHRAQQVTMLRHVAQAFNSGQHVMIEAPTGVGKSLAYLLPAITFATQNNDRVVISTNTINLQEQLINKDIPLLQTTLGIPFRAAVLKGRSNYLCPRRLAALRRRGPTSSEEMHVLAKLLVWLTMSKSGDRGEITLRGPVEVEHLATVERRR